MLLLINKWTELLFSLLPDFILEALRQILENGDAGFLGLDGASLLVGEGVSLVENGLANVLERVLGLRLEAVDLGIELFDSDKVINILTGGALESLNLGLLAIFEFTDCRSYLGDAVGGFVVHLLERVSLEVQRFVAQDFLGLRVLFVKELDCLLDDHEFSNVLSVLLDEVFERVRADLSHK